MIQDPFRSMIRSEGVLRYRDLPWRRTRDPYIIWLSEVMLQQTQVPRVETRMPAWLDRFPGGGAVVHNHRALNGLDDLADSDVVRTDLETHATVDATQALHNTGLDQTMLNRTGKRIRDIDLFGSGANRKQTLRILSKHRQHTKGVISLPRYVHFSPFKEYEQLERAPGPSLCRDAR